MAPEYLFAAAFLFVGVMLALSFRKRKLPPEGRLRQHLSPELRGFLESLPLPDDHPLAGFCEPWSPSEDIGYNKRFLPLWQTRDGAPSFVCQYIKWGSPVMFDGPVETESEQAFLAELIARVLAAEGDADRARRAADAVGFRYLDRVLASPDDDALIEEIELLAR